MKGKKGCLICLGDTQYVYLFGSKKLVYMRSRRFLPPSHRYRKMRKEFDGTEEKGRAPKHLDIRHAIDVMHVEKNVCDSILGILLNIKGKTKEGLKSRKDFIDLNIRH